MFCQLESGCNKVQTSELNRNETKYVDTKYIESKVLSIFLYLSLVLIPIVDMINGYNLLSNSDIGSLIGILFRIISIVFLLFLIVRKNKLSHLIFLYSLILFLFIVVIMNYFRSGNLIGFFDEITYATKLVLPILYMLGISNAVNNGIVNKDIVDKVLTFFSVIVPLTLIIPMIFDAGYSSYALGGGYKGFYYSNNELNILMISITIFSFWQFTAYKKRKFIILFLFNCTTMLLIGSKTSIFCVIILGIIYILKKFSFKSIFKILIVSLIASFLALSLFSEFINEIIFRFQHYYSITNGSDNIFNFLLSNRNLRIVPAINEVFLNNDNGFLNFLIGYGHYQQFDASLLQSIMEMDIIDTLIWYGFLVSFTIFGFYIYVLLNGLRKKNNFLYNFIYIIIFTFSMIAGHVLYSALAGGVFGIVGSCLLQKDNSNS